PPESVEIMQNSYFTEFLKACGYNIHYIDEMIKTYGYENVCEVAKFMQTTPTKLTGYGKHTDPAIHHRILAIKIVAKLFSDNDQQPAVSIAPSHDVVAVTRNNKRDGENNRFFSAVPVLFHRSATV